MTGAIFIDLKKAFDLVHHHCLLHKLEHHGIRGQIYNLFGNYLTARSQRKKYGKDLSSNLPLKDGVSQGSILGPLLFILYIYKRSTSVFIKIPYIDIEDIRRLRGDMDFIFEWQKQYLTSERSERVRY